jgi:hypothetical protein
LFQLRALNREGGAGLEVMVVVVEGAALILGEVAEQVDLLELQ